MAFNQGNDSNAVPPQQDPNQMTLGQLEQSQDMPPEVKSRAQAARTEMTVSIGGNEWDICGSSKLWHRYQNEMIQFSGGMHQTLNHSYIGNYDGDALEGPNGGAQYLFRAYPNIRSLNVVLNLVATDDALGPLEEQRDALFSSFYRLVFKYIRQLVSFKLWVRAELWRPMWQAETWYSEFYGEFLNRILGLLEGMTQCQVLWLDLMEVADPDAPRPIRPPEVINLANRLNNYPRALAYRQFAEFRFAANYIHPFTQGVNGDARPRPHNVLYNRLARIATMQRIHVRYQISAEEWLTVPQDVARRFQQNDITFGQPFGQLVDLFHKFNALNRVAIYVAPDGPRFAAIFQALTQVANLQVLELTIQQACLFTLEELYKHKHTKSATLISTQARLLALQVLAIDLDMRMSTHLDIMVAPLFASGNCAASRQLPNPLPSLITFDMSIREGNCRACVDQDQCIRQALIEWFEPLPSAAPGPLTSVIYCNKFHLLLGPKHVVYWQYTAPQ